MLGKDFKTPERTVISRGRVLIYLYILHMLWLRQHAETLSKRASVSVACVCAVLITSLTQFYIVVL